VEVKALYETFMSLNPEGRVDKETFKKGLIKLESAGLKNLQDTPFSDRLFHLLDCNGDGVVDLREFVSGLSMLCKGSIEEKLECTYLPPPHSHPYSLEDASPIPFLYPQISFLLRFLPLLTLFQNRDETVSFKAYDLDGNGFISKDELAAMFKSAWISGFKALSTIHGNQDLSMEDLNEFSEEMATLFADNAFETLDTNGDGKLSFEEFKEFALAEPKITATLNGFKKEVSITFY
jgi:Ca2+-binding EF-hand superfamily protein